MSEELTDADIAGLYHASQGQTLREQDASRVRGMARAVEAFLCIRSEAASIYPWISVADQLPDDELTVLLALTDGEVWTGFHDVGIWRYVSADPIETSRVAYWASMPAPPAATVAPMSRSTGMSCPVCCAKAGKPHLPSCSENEHTKENH